MDFNIGDYEEEKNFILNNPATPTLKLMRDFAKQYHEKQLTLTGVVKPFYCWDEQALGKERRCQEECDTCASVRKEK